MTIDLVVSMRYRVKVIRGTLNLVLKQYNF